MVMLATVIIIVSYWKSQGRIQVTEFKGNCTQPQHSSPWRGSSVFPSFSFISLVGLTLLHWDQGLGSGDGDDYVVHTCSNMVVSGAGSGLTLAWSFI